MKNTIKNKIKKDDSFNKDQRKFANKVIDLFDENNLLYISHRKLSDTLNKSRTFAGSILNLLVDKGYIKIIEKDSRKGYTYQLLLSETPSLSDSMLEPNELKCNGPSIPFLQPSCDNEEIIFDENKDEVERVKKETLSLKDFKNLTNKELNKKFYNKLDSIAITDKDLTKPISKLNHNPFATSSLKDKKIEILKNENELLRKMINIQNKFMELKADMQIFETKLKELGEELKKHHS